MGLVHRTASEADVRKAWGKDDDKLSRAVEIIGKRSSLRGRSVSATLVFIGFLVGVQGAILVCGITSDDAILRAAVKPIIPAMLALFVGMHPTWGNIIPRHRNAEALEALEMDECEAFIEEANRSSAQRSQLWRLRCALTVSFACTALALYRLYVFL